MIGFRVAALVALAIGLCATSGPAAQGGTPRHGAARPDIVPIKQLHGSTAGELLGEWWAQVLAIPAAENPLNPPNPGRCLRLGPHGRVASGAQNGAVTTTCTIQAGTPVFLGATLNECNSAKPDPVVTEEEQRACATTIFTIPEITAILLSVDGGPAVDIHDERFQTITPQMSVVFPEGALYDAEPGPATFVGAGYTATTRKPLRPGPHTITFEFVLNDGTSIVGTFGLNVVRSHRGKGSAAGPE